MKKGQLSIIMLKFTSLCTVCARDILDRSINRPHFFDRHSNYYLINITLVCNVYFILYRCTKKKCLKVIKVKYTYGDTVIVVIVTGNCYLNCSKQSF